MNAIPSSSLPFLWPAPPPCDRGMRVLRWPCAVAATLVPTGRLERENLRMEPVTQSDPIEQQPDQATEGGIRVQAAAAAGQATEHLGQGNGPASAFAPTLAPGELAAGPATMGARSFGDYELLEE